HPKQYHLDFEVDEFEPEHDRIVELGATFQKRFVNDEGYGWQVYTDPAEHPFCLCRNPGVTWGDGEMTWPESPRPSPDGQVARPGAPSTGHALRGARGHPEAP